MGVTIDEFGRRQTNFLDPIAVIFARVSSTDGRQDTERQVKEMKKESDKAYKSYAETHDEREHRFER